MGQPLISVVFREKAIESIGRSEKGTCLVIVRGTGAKGVMTSTVTVSELPSTLSPEAKSYVERAYIGYVKAPRAVLIYEMPKDGTIANALDAAALYDWDYVALPPDLTAQQKQTVAAWIKSQRDNLHRKYKAIIAGLPADTFGVVNFVADKIDIGLGEGKTLSGADYCARIAGLICGTPMNISCTYAPLPEVIDFKRLTIADADKAEETGQLVLLHDGTKVKLGRGVNSFITTTSDYGASFKKIKLVEIIDMIRMDLRKAGQDSYIGKYENIYDNKCVLLTAISGYLMELEQAHLVQPGYTVGINMAKQRAYLKKKGVDVKNMTDAQIKQADTGSYVFVKITVKLVDSIEDIDIEVEI